MEGDDFSRIYDVTMFRDEPFHPVTKDPVKKSSRLDCVVDTRYGTGMISCKEKPDKSLFTTILVTVVAIVACIFIFSIQFEFHHIEEIPIIYIFVMNPALLIVLIIVVAVIIVAVTRRK